ncbi:spore coat protein [Cytobacillus spongiae]|uniref:spore coat protein n=1 Tax=Cytobacillus spongiae TaxID=2901381 RepID=UPI001F46CA1F|nr:spore coat protein [Cytobacillus spongiae]UII55479.1 spore coat protein [Cytobacillus spongiae]
MLSGNRSCDRRERVAAAACDRSWNALDPRSTFPLDIFANSDGDLQDAAQVSDIEQRSNELIVLKNCLNVNVISTETQVAASLQAALQVAIALVINITILDSAEAERVTQDLLQYSQIQQVNRQSVYVENAKDCTIRMTDTDIAVSIQLMLQLLLALIIQLDIL